MNKERNNVVEDFDKAVFQLQKKIYESIKNGGTEMKKEIGMEEIRAELANYWNYERNGSLKPEDVKLNSSRVVWMRCKDGHEFTISIKEFTKGRRCPYDAARVVKLSVKYPELVHFFDFEKNGFGPHKIEFNSKLPLWWRCPNGHSYKMTISSKRRGKECPVCKRNEEN